MEKNPAGYFKLENWKNQVQINRGREWDKLGQGTLEKWTVHSTNIHFVKWPYGEDFNLHPGTGLCGWY